MLKDRGIAGYMCMYMCRDVCDTGAAAPSGVHGGPGPRPRRDGEGGWATLGAPDLGGAHGRLAGTWKGSGSLAHGHWAPSADKAACNRRLSGPGALITEQ